MEIKIRIGDTERVWGKEANTSWVNEQIQARQAAGAAVCVVVTVNGSGVDNLTFAAGDCGGSRGGAGTPKYTDAEERIIDTWKKLGVQETRVNAGKISIHTTGQSSVSALNKSLQATACGGA